MTRMEHQHSIHPTYSHHPHQLTESLHPHHPFSLAPPDIPHSSIPSRTSNRLPPLAYLSETAAVMSSTTTYNKENHVRRLDYGINTSEKSGDALGMSTRFTHRPPSRHQPQQEQQGYSRHDSNPGSMSDSSKGESCSTSLLQDDSEMNAASSDIQRRGSMSMDHTATLTPTPSPHGRPSDYAQDIPSHYNNQRYPNDNHQQQDNHHLASPDHQYNKYHDHEAHQQHYPQKLPGLPHSSQTTPSPPLPTQDGFQGRSLPPIDPSNPLHTHMNSSRRGSLADPEYYPPGPTSGVLRRPSVSMDSSNGYSAGGSGGGGGENRHYATTPPLPSAPEHHYPPYTHPSTSPMQLRQSEHGQGRRESLPSIHSSAGPIGQLLAQEPQRRHSIANGDHVGPLKRKTSATPLSQVHSSVELEHPSKRRDSIPDAALLHQFANHPHHHHPYHSRSSLSAPSSPPRRGSIAHAHGHGQVPVLNLQPAAEIKSSSSSSMMPSAPPPSQQNGSSAMMEHSSNRPLLPLHQPRRPSLLSDPSLSRRSSLADPHHYPAHFQQQQGHPHNGTSSSQDYDHNMNMDMERMHLSGNHGSSETTSQGQTQGGGHLYPGYPSSTYPEGAGAKGDTPYSRSPELRISHKLAERKRRKEMKELFDELRDSLPVDRSLKTSKWEILSKAVDYISNMKATQDDMANEIEMLRQEVARLQKN